MKAKPQSYKAGKLPQKARHKRLWNSIFVVSGRKRYNGPSVTHPLKSAAIEVEINQHAFEIQAGSCQTPVGVYTCTSTANTEAVQRTIEILILSRCNLNGAFAKIIRHGN